MAAINRAIAVAETLGLAAGLATLPALDADSQLMEYQPYWAARADLHARIGEMAAAREAYDHAIGLEADPAIRRFLQKRRTEVQTHLDIRA